MARFQIFGITIGVGNLPPSKLILDVIDNHGGQSPIPYYGLFYSDPYQEQYVQFKKIQEFEQEEILNSLFWGDKGKEIWFEKILRKMAH